MLPSNKFTLMFKGKKQFFQYILELKNDVAKRELFSKSAISKAEKFEIKNSLQVMSSIYKQFLK